MQLLDSRWVGGWRLRIILGRICHFWGLSHYRWLSKHWSMIRLGLNRIFIGNLGRLSVLWLFNSTESSNLRWVHSRISLSLVHSWLLHSWSHYASLGRGIWSLSLWLWILECPFKLVSLDILLFFDLFLNILVSLKKFVVFSFPQLKSLVKICLKLLFKGIHLILLLLDQFWLSSNDLLMSLIHVFVSLFSLHLPTSDLDFMSFLIFFLFG